MQTDCQKNYDIIVIGAGAAGMIAAGRAAQSGRAVVLLEKNRYLGAKLKITGNGRCNLTNAAPLADFREHYSDSGVFLHNAFSVFYNQELIALLQELGVPAKTEEKGRVFPVSERAEDVIDALRRYLSQGKVKIEYSCPVDRLLIKQGRMQGVAAADGTEFFASRVIVATGGASYPETGSAGDGYRWAEQSGHHVIELRPGLVGLEVKESWGRELPGLSLPEAEVSIVVNGKKIQKLRGEMIFTHFGFSGPLFLDASALIVDLLSSREVVVSLDAYPKATAQELACLFDEIARDTPHRQCKSMVSALVPQRLALVCLKRALIAPERKIHQLRKKEKSALINNIKALQLTIRRPRPLREAMITRGGVSTREINPKTMESKLVRGLYFCGEVIDVDGLSGGFNLQAAFSTGFVAGDRSARDG